MKKIRSALVLGVLLLPSVVSAQSPGVAQESFRRNSGKITSLGGLINLLIGLLESLIPAIFLLALLYFLWNVAQFVKADPKSRESAKYGIIESLIGLFVMTAVYGLIQVIAQTFPLDNTTPIIPRL